VTTQQLKTQEADFREGLPFLGGGLWIDFLNTQPVIDGEAVDLIGDEQLLAHWQRLARLPKLVVSAPSAVQALRVCLRAAFEAMRNRAPIPQASMDMVNGLLACLKVRRWIEPSGGGYQTLEDLVGDSMTIENLVALDFAAFAGNYEPERMKHCDNHKCTMVFYDRGKNNRRRWCSTAACGNRDKVANYRARKATKLAQGD